MAEWIKCKRVKTRIYIPIKVNKLIKFVDRPVQLFC